MSTMDAEGREGGTCQLRHRWGDDPPLSDRLVAAVAEHEGTDETALPPLGESINPGALDALFQPVPDGDPAPGCVTFSYYGYTVLVQSTGRVVLRRD